jgi:hypothetical protein
LEEKKGGEKGGREGCERAYVAVVMNAALWVRPGL